MAALVEYKQESDYSLITLDDGKANALGFDMLAQLGTALDTAEEAGKVVVICGRPGKFSAGFDLSVMGQGGDAMFDLLRAGAGMSRRMLNFPTPVVLAVSGHALAMGALLLLSADYRIGVHGTYKIGLNEVAIGMTLPYFGVALARERLTTTHLGAAVALARIYDAGAAVEAGYLDEAVSEEDLMSSAISMAQQLSALNMEAHRQTKARIREALNAALDASIEQELGAR
jgi:enoyl-CoA hydratase